MKTKTISLIALSLGICSMAFATEFKPPEFKEDFKVEGAVKTDRGIASEKESEREPSSVVTTEKKKVEEEPSPEDKVEPKPWLYRESAARTNSY